MNSPNLLELELTETLLLRQPEWLPGSLELLNSRGVRFAIDDFGTGYSSLRYLRVLPLHKIKIAQEFVRGVLDNEDDAAIVSAVVGLGHRLGLQVVAEGVETAEQVEFLRALDCDYAQGYFYMRPEPPETFLEKLEQ